jgi:hypothetical protein
VLSFRLEQIIAHIKHRYCIYNILYWNSQKIIDLLQNKEFIIRNLLIIKKQIKSSMDDINLLSIIFVNAIILVFVLILIFFLICRSNQDYLQISLRTNFFILHLHFGYFAAFFLHLLPQFKKVLTLAFKTNRFDCFWIYFLLLISLVNQSYLPFQFSGKIRDYVL